MTLAASGIIESIQPAFVQGADNGQYNTTALAYDATISLPPSGKQSDAMFKQKPASEAGVAKIVPAMQQTGI